jgi:hypothetical protein
MQPRTTTRLAAALSLAAALFAAAPSLAQAPAGSVLDVGGRNLLFTAAPQPVLTLALPFERDNALLLKEAQAQLKQVSSGPFRGVDLHVVLVTGPDAKLAFERARTVRAALVRMGQADGRALAAATGEQAPGATSAATTSAAPSEERIEQVEVSIVKLPRAACKACNATTLGTIALDTASVRLATLTAARRPPLASAAAATGATPGGDAGAGALSADRREPAANLAFSDRPALAPRPLPPRPATIDDLLAAPTRPTPPSLPRVVADAPLPPVKTVQRRAAAGQAADPADRRAASAAAQRRVDLVALGVAPGPGCRPRRIIIDDYSAPIRTWTCSTR